LVVLLGVLILFLGVGFGVAYNSEAEPSVMGHSADEISGLGGGSGGFGAFGDWTSKDSDGNNIVRDTKYKATGDGFLLISITGSNRWVKVYSGIDLSSDWTMRGIVTSAHAVEGNPRGSLTLPLREGDYMEFTTGTPDYVGWMPIGGDGVLEKQ